MGHKPCKETLRPPFFMPAPQMSIAAIFVSNLWLFYNYLDLSF